MEITEEMREIARQVNRERSTQRVKKSWGNDKESLLYQSRWAKQIFLRIYRVDRIKARKWAVSRFGAERAKALIAIWL